MNTSYNSIRIDIVPIIRFNRNVKIAYFTRITSGNTLFTCSHGQQLKIDDTVQEMLSIFFR